MTQSIISVRLLCLYWRIAALLSGALILAASRAHAAAAIEPASPTIELAVGAQKLIAQGRILQRVSISDPTVADVLPLRGRSGAGGGVMLLGKAAGTTGVMLWESGRDTPIAYTVEVTAPAASGLLNAQTPKVVVLGNTAVISGATPTMESHQRAVAVAKSAVGKDGSVFDTSTIATGSVVQVDVKVVEFSKAVLKEAGFNLFVQRPSGFAFGSFSPSSLSSYTGGATTGLNVVSASPIGSAFNLLANWGSQGVFANLSILESNNLARVLAEPTLVALSGQSASFLAGGEIPVPVPEALGTISIVYKPYGIGLTLTPTVLGPQRIALKIAPEASQLDFVHAVTINGVSVPAITTRRADTTVELGDGESYLIGGLVDRETASNVNKVPVLGDLPVIGTFFKSLQYTQNDRELVIIVTPHLVSPIARGAALPSTPGEQSEQRGGPVWRSYLGGVATNDAVPGFSQ